jgi:hypothetical protein
MERTLRPRRHLLVLLCLALVGCAGGDGARGVEADLDANAAAVGFDEAGCVDAIVGFVDELQDFADVYEGLTAQQFAAGEPPEGAGDLDGTFESYSARLTALDCPSDWAEQRVTVELERLSGASPIAGAIVDQLKASLLGVQADAAELSVTPDDDLAATVVAAPAGSTVRLEAGEHRVEEPLLVLQDLTIVGAGAEDTVVSSSAEGVALLATGSAALVLEDLTLSLDVDGTVGIYLEAPAYALRRIHVTGARLDGEGGGIGIVVADRWTGPVVAGDAEPLGRTIEEVEVRGNEGGGISVLGVAAPELRRLTVLDNGSCGVCYLGHAGGTLADSRLGGNEIGVWAEARSRAVVEGNAISGPGAVGMVFSGTATGAARDNEVSGYPVGIETRDQAGPELEGNLLEGTGSEEDVALLLRGGSVPRTSGNVCRGNGFGLALLDAAAPTLGDDGCEVTDERSG